MLKSYFKLACRNLLKNKIPSAINLFGLSITLACGILAYLFVYSELNRDTFHEKADNIFLVEHTVQEESGLARWGKSPAPLGPMLRDDHAAVNEAVRIAEAQILVVTDDFHFSEFARFVDPAFFSMFSFPMRNGNPRALYEENSVVLTPEMALKYFEGADPLGQTLYLRINGGEPQPFTVTGVVEKLPVNTSLGFSLLLPISTLEKANTDFNTWANLVRATFIEVTSPAALSALRPQMQQYIDAQQSAVGEAHPIEAFSFNNLKEISHNAADVKYQIAYQVNWAPITVLCTITGFLFLLACFNYMNITLGAMHTRMREIGIRKVMGSRKQQLVVQFLAENIVLCLLALALGVVIAQTMLIPGFTYITNGLDLTFKLSERHDLWLYLVALVTLLGFLSGVYPAFYVSSFKPVVIFSGRLKAGGPKKFMLSLLSFQFVFALITMVLSVGLALNKQYLEHIDWGYNNSETLVVHVGPDSYDTMHQAARQTPGIVALSGARNHVGTYPIHTATLKQEGGTLGVSEFVVAPDYFDVLQPKLLVGTLPMGPGDVLINESMAALFDKENPVDQLVSLDSSAFRVAGVTQDFHFQDFAEAISPAYFRTSDVDAFAFLTMRLQPGVKQAVTENLAAVWQSNFPEATFSYYFQDESFSRYFEESGRINKIFYFAALFALILSCAGLFGIASQHIASRLKEMSIRKIMGATAGQIIRLTNKRFAILLSIAAILATPVGYMILQMLLPLFGTYYMPVGMLPFVIAFGLVLCIAGLTLLSQIIRLTTVNPIDLLRSE